MKLESEEALVVFSGGQDSTTCLYWAKNRFSKILALSFDYGQKHAIELECAQKIARLARVEHQIMKLDLFGKISNNSLVCKDIEVDQEIPDGTKKELPNTFVPARNLLFLTQAAALAYSRNIRHIITGVCETDYSGYPDCRDDTIKALQVALNLGMNFRFVIHTPLMWLSKAESIILAQEEGALEALAHSHTCYNGLRPPCGLCPACKLRNKGFLEAGLIDPLFAKTQE